MCFLAVWQARDPQHGWFSASFSHTKFKKPKIPSGPPLQTRSVSKLEEVVQVQCVMVFLQIPSLELAPNWMVAPLKVPGRSASSSNGPFPLPLLEEGIALNPSLGRSIKPRSPSQVPRGTTWVGGCPNRLRGVGGYA